MTTEILFFAILVNGKHLFGSMFTASLDWKKNTADSLTVSLFDYISRSSVALRVTWFLIFRLVLCSRSPPPSPYILTSNRGTHAARLAALPSSQSSIALQLLAKGFWCRQDMNGGAILVYRSHKDQLTTKH